MLCSGGVNSAPSTEREILLTLLGALEQPESAAELPPADPRVLKVARYHRLSPLLSVVCARALPCPLMDAFRRDRILTTARGMMLGQVAEECVGALGGRGIPSILLKGLDYDTRLYQTSGVRPTSDVDLLVPNEHRRDAFAVLDALGFEPRAAAPGFDDPDYHEVAWFRRDVEIDLHMGLAPFARCRIDYRRVWADREPFRLGATDTAVLARTHAAIFQALHMAIDHFGVPAIYLVDLVKLMPAAEDVQAASEVAATWGCRRPLETAVSLAAAFLPGWGAGVRSTASAMAARITEGYGRTKPLARPEQLLRKLAHFDGLFDCARYVAIQAARNIRERFERDVRKRSARERLGLPATPRLPASDKGW